MNGLIAQLPEWMRSPAALIAGGLILLFLLVWVLRRRSESGIQGLPSGRGWRGKVPLPHQASPLDAMRAALESSRRIEPLPQPETPPSEPDDIPPPEAVADASQEAPVADSGDEAAAELDAGTQAPGEKTEASQAEEADAEGSKPGADAEASRAEEDEASEDESAKVVPLHAGTTSSNEDAVAAEADADEASAPERAREQKG